MIAQLGLIWQRRGRAILADGTTHDFDIYQGDVTRDGQPRRIAIDEADTMPLVGMILLQDYELTIQVRTQGQVTLRPLP